MSRVLVTGATGFIGRHVLPLLAQAGHEVHAVARRPEHSSPGTAQSLQWHAADLLDPDAAERLVERARPQRLLHLAWYAEHGAYWESVENLRWVEATLRLLRAFAAADGERAVGAGTCAEYVWNEERCVEGQTPLEPASLYGVAKDATRRLAEAFARRAPFELAWGRVFFLYGPGEDERRLVPTVARALIEDRPAQLGGAELTRDFMHVEDVAGAFAALVDGEVQGAVNIASGHGASLREIVALLAAAAGVEGQVHFGAPRPGEPQLLVGANGRLTNELGFAPRIALPDGLATALRLWRERDG